MLEYQIFFDYAPMLLTGFLLTIKIVVCSIALGIPLGLILALGRKSNFVILGFLSTSFIELFRNTPFIIQVFLFYYVLPFYGLRFSAELIGILALAAFVFLTTLLVDGGFALETNVFLCLPLPMTLCLSTS